MKFLKVLLFVGIVACLALLGVNFIMRDSVWQGGPSESTRESHSAKEAEPANSRQLCVYVDGREALSDRSGQQLFMSDQMELMAAPQALVRLLDVTVSSAGADSYEISDGQSVCTFSCGSDQIVSEAETLEFSDSVVMADGKPYFALRAVCQAFDQGYSFESEENAAKIERTGQEDPTALPVKYDMRTDGRVPAVGSQGSLGTCWAFAALSALESTLLPQEQIRFSVDHMTMNNGYRVDQNSGGDYYMALSYLASWRGPVLEEDDPYGDSRTDPTLPPVRHLQGAVKIADKDYETIKRMIYTRGAVQSCFYSDIEVSNASSQYYNRQTASYYYSGDAEANHDIVIVGWDDHYPRDYFNNFPKNDGAFLCQNSWGSDFGWEGYFYISYEDTNIGVYNIVYTDLEAADNYSNIYQSDQLGWLGSIGYNRPEAWFANVYTAGSGEKLAAASFYATDEDTFYEVYAVPDYGGTDDLDPEKAVFMESGHLQHAGYYTVDFAQEIPVDGPFAVMAFVQTDDAVHPVAVEYGSEDLKGDVDLSDGTGFISYDAGAWQQVEPEYQCNICLKAFTNSVD